MVFDDFSHPTMLIMLSISVSMVMVEHYLDDFITVGPANSSECQNNLDFMVETCAESFGVNPIKDNLKAPHPPLYWSFRDNHRNNLCGAVDF